MKKKLIGILFCMLMIIPALSATVSADPPYDDFKTEIIKEKILLFGKRTKKESRSLSLHFQTAAQVLVWFIINGKERMRQKWL